MAKDKISVSGNRCRTDVNHQRLTKIATGYAYYESEGHISQSRKWREISSICLLEVVGICLGCFDEYSWIYHNMSTTRRFAELYHGLFSHVSKDL